MKSLNHVYRTIWSEALGAWIAVSEITRSRGKRSASSVIRAIRLVRGGADGDMLRASIKPFFVAVACCFALNAQANPMGGAVVNGSATFNSTGSTLTVTNTPGTIINWQNFSIDAGEVTHFAQQSAASTVLNRVVTNNPSNILGTLSSNGQVYLLNANGIMFGAGATVDVAGLVATSLNLSDADFLAGRHDFTAVEGAQNISNAGNINAQQGGQIYLIAPNVENTGIITAPGGEVLLAAGHSVQIVNSNDPALRVEITAPAGEATNLGQLIVGSGKLGLFGAVVKNSGLASADSAVMEGGRIVFKSSLRTEAGGTISASGTGGGRIDILSDMQTGTVEVSGTLEAKASGSGDGGFIETSAANVHIADTTRVSTLAANGKNGTWLIDPVDFTISAGGAAQTISGIGATTLQTGLGLGNVIITTDAGTTGNGDIFVNAPVTWNINLLTLSAHRNIYINANLDATLVGAGGGQLSLLYGQGAATAGNTADYYLGTGAQVFLPAGLNFHTTLGNTAGAQIDYTVITALGTQGSTTGTDLQGMIPTGNYVLGAEIDASATGLSPWATAGGFAPVGAPGNAFSGRFDGLGHSITGLYINRPATNYVGLFGMTNSASIRNVGLLNASITGSSYVGGFAGYFFDGSIRNSYVQTSTITGNGGLVGGLVGYDLSGIITNSYATGNTVVGNDSVGGLVGNLAYGTISDSNADNGNVVGTSNVGALVGYNFGGTITNSHYAIDGANALTVNSLNILMRGGIYSAQYADWLANALSLNIADYSATLASLGGNNYGINSVQGMRDLLGFAENAAYTFTLSGSIDLTSAPGLFIPYLAADFNGGGFTVSNLNLNQSSAPELGMFGRIAAGTTVSNLTLANATVTGGNNVGALAGWNEGVINSSNASGANVSGGSDVGGLVGYNNVGDILNSYASGGTVAGTARVGGLVGQNASGTIDASHVSGVDVLGTASAMYVGGLVGLNDFGTISNSYVDTGTVVNGGTNVGGLLGYDGGEGLGILQSNTVTGVTVAGVTNVGGLVGMFEKGTYWSGTGYVDDNHVVNSAVSGGTNAGGLIGNNGTSISNSSVTGTTVIGTGSMVGGLVGLNASVSSIATSSGAFAGGIISNSYVSGGTVSGNSLVGGIAGQNQGDISTSYVSTSSISGADTPAANSVGGLAGNNDGNISNSYISGGTVSGGNYVGGLVGQNTVSGSISFAYADPTSVTGIADAGGVAGFNTSGTIINTYWNSALIGGILTNGIANTGNGVSDIGAVGLTSTEMMNIASFAGWDIASSSGTGSVWYIIEGQSTPMLNGVGITQIVAPPITNPLLDALVGGIADTEERKNWEVDEYAEGDGVVTQDGSLPVCR